MEPERIHIQFGADAVADLRDRLAGTRWPGDYGNDDWRYGANQEWMQETLDYWRDGFDFTAFESALNRWDHYRVVLDDVPIHYLHARGNGPAPVPLVLTHGWPWTFWDFQHVIGPLSDPAAYGGDPADAFDVIVPALPGYPLSGPLTKTGVNVRATAALWVELMQGVLGYGRFGVHGGDWGASVTAQLAHEYADRLIGAHLSLPVLLSVSYYSGLTPEMYGPDEQGWYEKMQARMATANAHVAVHTTDPQTLAYAFNDSPAAGRVDPGASPALERQRRRRVRRDLARRPARGAVAVLVRPVDRDEHALLLGAVEEPGADRARPHAGARGADRDRRLPRRPGVRAPGRRRAPHQPAPLDRDAAGWPLRGGRGTRPPRRRPARLLPPAPVTRDQSVTSNWWDQ